MTRSSRLALIGVAAAAVGFLAVVGVASLVSGSAAGSRLIGDVGTQAARNTASNPFVLAAATPSATPTCSSNEDATHEKSESAAREAEEANGFCHGAMHGGFGHGSNEDPTHEANESPEREAQEGTPSSPAPAPSNASF
jgi:hypothetical protein